MDIEGLKQGEQVLNARRVFGEPIERDGSLIIPAAKVRGGAGGGNAEKGEDRPAGEGGGFGMSAKPAGVYLVKGDQVRWVPSVDVNRIIAGAQLVAACGLLAFGLSQLGGRKRRRWRRRR